MLTLASLAPQSPSELRLGKDLGQRRQLKRISLTQRIVLGPFIMIVASAPLDIR